jgi:hypothetical protein
VVTKKLGSDYYKKKGEVTSLVDEYTANVRILDDKGKHARISPVEYDFMKNFNSVACRRFSTVKYFSSARL